MRIRLGAAVLAGMLAVSMTGGPASAGTPSLTWDLRPTGTSAQFRGLDVVNHRVAWVAGTEGTVLRTTDRGRNWENVSPPSASGMQFRDIEAFDARRAVALTIGPGEESRIYRTTDGGRSWDEVFRNDHPDAFYNCVGFVNRRRGLAVSDPVDGKFRILETSDGGRTWRVQSPDRMPPALGGEYNFAASGTCLVTGPGRSVWFATGGESDARVFRSNDGGRSWAVSSTRIGHGPSAGIYSLAFRDRLHGIAVGGDYTTPDTADRAAAVTSDGGRTWTLVSDAVAPRGYRSGVAWVGRLPVALAVGPTGSDVSWDGGRTWTSFDDGAFDVVDRAGLTCFASGPDGRVGQLSLGATER
ncbi:MAG TPA: oxidoreductase [Actinopolymorphaceae bacterium]